MTGNTAAFFRVDIDPGPLLEALGWNPADYRDGTLDVTVERDCVIVAAERIGVVDRAVARGLLGDLL